MCGIVGYWSAAAADKRLVERMADRIRHRGPDDSGLWLNGKGDLAFAHRRLSVIDVSPAGHQPMTSPCGRFTLVFNGEIYNHRALRAELEACDGHFEWRGHSDTETLLAALRRWGGEETLKRLDGMFAFALYDSHEDTLYLARDRLGEKPLYYGRSRGCFMFGSELKSLAVHPSWSGEIDRSAQALYMRYNYVPAPRSIYLGINKLLPATYVVVRDQGADVSEPRYYWDLKRIVEEACPDPGMDLRTHIDSLDSLLRKTVLSRMSADVPLGAFLSGGIDSTMVVALMQAQSSRPIRTFTIGFNEQGYSEAAHARKVAEHLGTDHTEMYVTPQETMAVIPGLSGIWDEPFSDSSQIPTLLISRLAKRHVTVSLSGDGGDELFCGYNRYAQGYRAWRASRRIPSFLRPLLARPLRRLPGDALETLVGLLPLRHQTAHLSDRLSKLADVIEVDSGLSYYRRLVSHWLDPASVVRNGREPPAAFDSGGTPPGPPGLLEYMMYMDTVTYLPDDILTKVDRASMAESLEVRVPFLGHEVVEHAWKIPMALKYRDGRGKWLLREVLYRYVPREIMDRPKMGFEVPIARWLKGPLREWCEELLAEKRLLEEGNFHPAPIRSMWDGYISGRNRQHSCLWDVLMFQAWFESWKARS